MGNTLEAFLAEIVDATLSEPGGWRRPDPIPAAARISLIESNRVHCAILPFWMSDVECHCLPTSRVPDSELPCEVTEWVVAEIRLPPSVQSTLYPLFVPSKVKIRVPRFRASWE